MRGIFLYGYWLAGRYWRIMIIPLLLMLIGIPCVYPSPGGRDLVKKDACGDQGVCICKDSKLGMTLSCDNRSLTEVPSNIPTNTTILDLSSNLIEELTEDDFMRLCNLTQLYLTNNLIMNISAGLFLNMSSLTELSLRNNSIRKLPESVFSFMRSLRSLDIADNMIEELPNEIFQNLPKLKYLKASRNHFTYVSSKIFSSLTKLVLLDLSYNYLSELPDDLFNSSRLLDTIKLKSNHIAELPNGLFASVPHLKMLYLDRNTLTTLPDSIFESNVYLSRISITQNKLKNITPQVFRKLERLTYIDLSNNSLQTVSSEMFSKPSIVNHINLATNDIRYLPESLLENMPQLEFFAIARNKLTQINKNLFLNNPRLRTLDVSKNQLQSIPENLLQLAENLQTANFLNNSLVEVPATLFNASKRLTQVKFSWNPITSVPEGLFRSCKDLKEVFWQHSSISHFPDDFLQDSSKLETLIISTNCLESLPANLFAEKTELKKLDLYSNKLKIIPASTFWNTSKLRFLQLHGNGLTEIPDGLLKFTPVIYYLDVSSNNVQKVTRMTLHGTRKLVTLNFANNSITHLPSDLLSEVEVLDKLDLSSNMITDLPAGLFNFNNRSHSLKLLFLHKNRIEFIPTRAFAGLYSVQYIFLYDNKIHSLAEGAFEGTGVAAIYLFSNQLSAIQGSPFSNTNISEIHLYSNDIQNVSSTTLLGMGNKTILYLSCQNLAEAPWAPKHIKINCVSPLFVPTLRFQRTTLPNAIRQQGFNCNISKTGTSTCQPCKPGTFGDGINGCTPCPSGGFYQDEIAQTASYQGGMACKKCNNGTFVEGAGGIAIDQCKVCPEGTNQSTEAGFRACTCKRNYARTDRFGPCERCLDEGLNCTDHEFKALLPGYYWNWTFPSANLEDYSLFVKNLKDESRFYDNYYANYSGQLPKIYKCPRSKSCENNESHSWTGIAGSCGVGYTGWLCSKCKDGFFMVLSTCVSCPDKIWLIIEFIIIIGLCVIFYLVVIWQYKRDQRKTNKQRTVMDIIVSRSKIILGFYQVVGEFFDSLHDVSWAGGLQVIGEFISYIELNVLRVLVRPQCYDKRFSFNPKVEFIIGLSLPVFVSLCAVLCYYIYKGIVYYRLRKTRIFNLCEEKLLKMKTKLTTLIMVLLFVMYPSICTVIFQLLPRACKTFCLDSRRNYCLHLLRSDYEITCESLSYYQYAAYCATVLYVVLFPCTLFYLLRKHCSLKPEILPNTRIQETEPRLDEHNNLLEDDSGEIQPNVPIWLNFLCENYKSQYWYWEILELTRKVTQTVLVTLLGWEDKLTMLLTIGISVVFLTLHARFWPMKDAFDQRLQMFSLTAIFINVIVAAMQVSEDYEGAITVFLIVLNIVVLVMIAGEGLLVLVRHLRHLRPHRIFVIAWRRIRMVLRKRHF